MARLRTIALVTAAALTLTLAAPAQAAARYPVRWGDTLTWIAQDHGLSLGRLAHANHLHPYAVLVTAPCCGFPRPRPHTRHHTRHETATPASATGRHRHEAADAVSALHGAWGDTLTAIAARHGTTSHGSRG